MREGYRRMHATLREHRDALLAPDGPLAAFSRLPVRHIHRATERYMRAMWSGLAPESLGSPERWRATIESHLARTGADTEPEVLEVEVATLAAMAGALMARLELARDSRAREQLHSDTNSRPSGGCPRWRMRSCAWVRPVDFPASG